MAKILAVKGRQVWDSRGRATVEAEVIVGRGTKALALGRAIAPSGASTARATTHSSAASASSCAISDGVPARTRPLSMASADGAGAASSGSPRASSSRRSGSRSSYSRNTSRMRERLGSRDASAAMSRSISTSRWIVASCLDTRASSACSSSACLRFGPLMSST